MCVNWFIFQYECVYFSHFLFHKSGKKSSLLSNAEIEAAEAEQHALLMQQYQLKVLDSQQVLVIQPYYHSSSPNARQSTTEELMMSETLGLVKTLGWKVVDGIMLSIQVGF